MSSSNDFKFVQQHLANERTFLAWIRTSITIVGMGILAAGVVFRSSTYSHIGHLIAVCIGIVAIVFGGAVMAISTKDYFLKRNGINNEAFRSASSLVWFIVISLGIVDLMLVGLVILMLDY